jgi:hypothetical protein
MIRARPSARPDWSVARVGQGAARAGCRSEQPGERMALERVAGFGVFIPYPVAPVPAEPLQPTWVRGEAHAGGHAAAIQAVAAEGRGVRNRW